VRINFSPNPPAERLSAALRAQDHAHRRHLPRKGWHSTCCCPDVHHRADAELRELTVSFTVAHMGLFPARNGVTQPGFQELLALADDGSETLLGQAHRHLSFLAGPPLADVTTLARR